jgi:hypothetical protein
MAKPHLTFIDYLTEAFAASPNVKGLGPIPVNKLFLAGVFILGFANLGFWFVGLALELVYLWMLSTNSRFQKYVQAKRMNVVEGSKTERINAMISTLEPAARKRLEQLNKHLKEIADLMDFNAEGAIGFVRETKLQTLNQLPSVFLKLLVSRQLMLDSLGRTDAHKIKEEIKDLTRQLDVPDISEAMTRSLRGSLEIQSRRLDNVQRAQENLRLIDLELSRIENQVELVREEIALDRSPEGLTANIDRINSTLDETNQWMNTHSDFFSRLGGNEEFSIPLSNPAGPVGQEVQ